MSTNATAEPSTDGVRALYAGRGAHGKADPRAGFRSLVQPDAGEYLYTLAREFEARRTFEVGLAYGGSALFLCRALAENGGGEHVAIDPRQTARYEGVGVQNVVDDGHGDQFRCIEAPSYLALPEMLANEGPNAYDLAFIDGNHVFDYVLTDFFYADLLVRPGGLVVFDDLWMPSVRRVVSFVRRNRAYDLLPAPPSSESVRARAGRAVRRLVQRPRTLWRHPLNACALHKTADDGRKWDFHRSF